jgi:CDP-2,3-bis-(O-geranylgeranyl)-sn-glycerol synthase
MDPLAVAAFLILAFVAAGAAQAAWFASAHSRRFAVPLDGGLTCRGRRIFGDHKTARGFVVMVPAAASAFAALAAAVDTSRIWPLPIGGYAGLGALAGLGFMAGELPNSFVKRQLGIAPGEPAAGRARAAVQCAIDHVDSAIGMLLAIRLVVPVPALTWGLIVIAGPVFHLLFSVLFFRLGLKTRAA